LDKEQTCYTELASEYFPPCPDKEYFDQALDLFGKWKEEGDSEDEESEEESESDEEVAPATTEGAAPTDAEVPAAATESIASTDGEAAPATVNVTAPAPPPEEAVLIDHPQVTEKPVLPQPAHEQM